jgi:probable phosphoglycerate mutase
MARTLVIARHGNTFAPGQTPTRVGAHTDLDLVEEKRGRSVGKYLKSLGIFPGKIYAAPLKRTTQTTQLAAEELGFSGTIIPESDFTEIDYGPDENKTEEEVELRLGLLETGGDNMPVDDIKMLGRAVIEKWNECAVPPPGWKVDVQSIINAWENFAEGIVEDESVLLCTSNGIIRFAPHILNGDYKDFCKTHDIKVVTGGVCIFVDEGKGWKCTHWNEKPYKMEF